MEKEKERERGRKERWRDTSIKGDKDKRERNW
jgi:hypothetical protein